MLPRLLTYALAPAEIMRSMGRSPDPWQEEVLVSNDNLLLNIHRQGGKSTVVGAKAAHVACFQPHSPVLILSKAQRQAQETFRKCLDAYYAMSAPVPLIGLSKLYAEFANGSRIISLPGREDTVRSYAGVRLLIIDEAARVPDDLYRAVRPMLAVSQGQLILLSTPFGKRGFFYREWTGDGRWKRIKVSADQCHRISREFLDEERRAMGDSWFLQEYFNSFESVQGLVYPDFHTCLIDDWPYPSGRKVGGIDWVGATRSPPSGASTTRKPTSSTSATNDTCGTRRYTNTATP